MRKSVFRISPRSDKNWQAATEASHSSKETRNMLTLPGMCRLFGTFRVQAKYRVSFDDAQKSSL